MDSRKRFKTVVWTPIDWCVFDDNEDSYFWKRIYLCGQDLSPLSLPAPVQKQADLATERERHLTTAKRAERNKLDFRCPICRSAVGQTSCFICARRSSTDIPVLLLNQPNIRSDQLRSKDGDSSENVAEKVTSRSFNLHRDYSKSLTLSNVGEPS